MGGRGQKRVMSGSCMQEREGVKGEGGRGGGKGGAEVREKEGWMGLR